MFLRHHQRSNECRKAIQSNKIVHLSIQTDHSRRTFGFKIEKASWKGRPLGIQRGINKLIYWSYDLIYFCNFYLSNLSINPSLYPFITSSLNFVNYLYFYYLFGHILICFMKSVILGTKNISIWKLRNWLRNNKNSLYKILIFLTNKK